MFDQMIALGKTLLQWIDDHMDPELAANLPMRLRDTISEPNTLLRVLHYPALEGNEEVGAVRAAAHEDINLITLLPRYHLRQVCKYCHQAMINGMMYRVIVSL